MKRPANHLISLPVTLKNGRDIVASESVGSFCSILPYHDIRALLYGIYPHVFGAANHSLSITNAIHFADSRFSGKFRRDTPEALITHSLYVADMAGTILLGLNLGEKRDLTIQKAILHDIKEDTPTKIREVRTTFDKDCAAGVKRLSNPEDENLELMIKKNPHLLTHAKIQIKDAKNAFKINVQTPRLHADELVIKAADAIHKCRGDTIAFLTDTLHIGSKKYPTLEAVEENITHRRIFVDLYIKRLGDPEIAAYFGARETGIIKKRIKQIFNIAAKQLVDSAKLSIERSVRHALPVAAHKPS